MEPIKVIDLRNFNDYVSCRKFNDKITLKVQCDTPFIINITTQTAQRLLGELQEALELEENDPYEY